MAVCFMLGQLARNLQSIGKQRIKYFSPDSQSAIFQDVTIRALFRGGAM
jgi:hypothetical protein